MSAITRFFFRDEVTCRSTAEVIGWWESRRLPFNVAVGATGVFSYAAVQLILLMPPRPMPIPLAPSLVGALVYGILANVCYTGGWMGELWLRRALGRDTETAGPTLFRYGFAFSIGLTLFPIAIASLLKLSLVLRAIL
jgi:hypothetical protein